MPRIATTLSALEIARLKPPEKGAKLYSVGGVSGLHLRITSTGAKSWILRTVINGKRRDVGLGSAAEVSLGQARDRALVTKDAAWEGRDPVMERRARAQRDAQKLTFAQAVEKYLASKLSELRNAKHRQQWANTLATYAIPIIGDLPVDQITVIDVQRTLHPIWQSKTETASRLRGRIERVLSWATVAGHREGANPARWSGNLDQVLPSPKKIAKARHHPAVALKDLPEFWTDLCAKDSIAATALRFMTLTAARAGEVRGAEWCEIDWDKSMWIVPGARMKARREHRVPLSAAAVELLRTLPRTGKFIFPGDRKPQLSENTLSKSMKTLVRTKDGEPFTDGQSGAQAVPHGLRSSFRDWAAQAGVDRDLAELSLAHDVGTRVERAYRRSDLIERRRHVMDAWAGVLEGTNRGDIIELKAINST